jgi:hypothetical protein
MGVLNIVVVVVMFVRELRCGVKLWLFRLRGGRAESWVSASGRVVVNATTSLAAAYKQRT